MIGGWWRRRAAKAGTGRMEAFGRERRRRREGSKVDDVRRRCSRWVARGMELEKT